jgi:hypothetical protein
LAAPLAITTRSMTYSNSFLSGVVSYIEFLAQSMATLCLLNQSYSKNNLNAL